MTGLALGVFAVGVGLVLLGGAMLNEARRIRRDADRNLERALASADGRQTALVDRLLNVTGHTWTLPPAMLSETRQPEPDAAEVVRADVEAFAGAVYEPDEPVLASGNGAGVL